MVSHAGQCGGKMLNSKSVGPLFDPHLLPGYTGAYVEQQFHPVPLVHFAAFVVDGMG